MNVKAGEQIVQRVTLRPAAAARFRLWAYQALRDAWNVSATLQTRAGARGGVLTSSRQKSFNYSGFLDQSNFDLGSSGGPLAYMRNNVLERYSGWLGIEPMETIPGLKSSSASRTLGSLGH